MTHTSSTAPTVISNKEEKKMIVLLVAICACAAIAAYTTLRVTEWLEKKMNKKFPVGKIKKKKGE